MTKFFGWFLIMLGNFVLSTGCVMAAYVPECPPVARGDCSNFYSRVSGSVVVSGFEDSHTPLPVTHDDLFTDMNLMTCIEIEADVSKAVSLQRLSRELRDSPRCLLILSAYYSPDTSDALVIVPVLRKSLKDKLSGTRALAATGLGKFGSAAEEMVPELAKALKDDNYIVRVHAAKALWQIRQSGDMTFPTLTEALKSEEPDVPDLAALFLGEIGSAAWPAVPTLCEALRHKNAQVRAQAMIALGRIGPAAKAAVPALRQAAQDPCNACNVSVMVSSPGIQGKPLRYVDQKVRSYASNALRAIGGTQSP